MTRDHLEHLLEPVWSRVEGGTDQHGSIGIIRPQFIDNGAHLRESVGRLFRSEGDLFLIAQFETPNWEASCCSVLQQAPVR